MNEPDFKLLAQRCMSVMVDAFLMHPHPDPKMHAAILKLEAEMRGAGISPLPVKYAEK